MTSMNTHSSRLRRGDLITDPSGNYARYGPVVDVYRAGLRWIATTEDGTQLSFGLLNLITINRPERATA